MRLDRLLANMGAGSRKDVRKLIAQGAVRVNGAVIRDCGFDVNE
ncbi:MAG: 16S rRNA pseudouridine(516) synthase, partial [Clostridia bacterium]|nr:16S rRNA pseudouridine(516) synthase [Clostridia bacterium]